MENIFLKLRTEKGLSQDQLADRVLVTRQAVSRWENGETVPNTETLKRLSKEFDVSINTLLGEPRSLICQCCGMPLSEDNLSHNADGTKNESYCHWCYADGTYTYHDMDDLLRVCVPHLVNEQFTEAQARAYMEQLLPGLDYWKNHAELDDDGAFEALKATLIDEFNALHIDGMPPLTYLNALVGRFVNLAYPLPSGAAVPFLNNDTTYLGNQLESELVPGLCFGVLANRDFLLVSTYEAEGQNPTLVLYKKR